MSAESKAPDSCLSARNTLRVDGRVDTAQTPHAKGEGHVRTIETMDVSTTGEAVTVWRTVTGLGLTEEVCTEVVKTRNVVLMTVEINVDVDGEYT